MAGKIKGITITLGADVQPLNKALADVNKKSKDLQSELKQVSKLLKMDPGNTELLAQKQKLLAEAVENSKEKLDRLKTAQEQVNEQFKKGEISEEQYRAFQREVVKAEQDLNKFERQLAEVTRTTKSWHQQLDKASAGLKSAGAKMSDMGKGLSTKVTAPIAAAGGAILALGIKAGETADRLLDLRDITGLSTDSIQEWQYVANQAGVESETMTKAVEGLTRKIPQLEQESKLITGQLNKLGLSFADLKEMSPDEQIDTLIGLLAEMEDPLDRNAVGAQLFGGAWKDLAPILGMGADGIAAVRQEARDLGLILDEDSIVKANEFRQQMDKLKASVSAIVFSIGAELGPVLKDELGPIINDTIVPALRSMAEGIGKLVRWFADLSPASQKTILALTGILAALGPILVILGPIISAIGGVIGAISALGAAMAAGATGIGILTTAFPVLGGALAAITGPIGIAIAAVAALIAIGVTLYKNWDEVKAKAEEIWNKIKDFFSKTLEKIKQTFEKVWNGIKDFFARWGKDLLLVVAGPAGWAVLLGKRITENWDLIKNATNRVWGNIKTAITQPIESARQTIMSIIQRIKDAFANLRITIPKPKLPHIEVDWRSVGIGDARINIPKFSLNWYKTGGIFARPSIIGVGEAGTEVVAPLDRLPGLIADALRDAMGGGQVAMAGGITIQNMYVRNDQDIKLIARELYNLQQTNARGRGLR